jgi:hypothetical protein
LYQAVNNLTFLKGHGASLVRSNARNLQVKTLDTIYESANDWYQARHNAGTTVKEFTGFSGSKVTLVKNLFPIKSTNSYYLIKKQGNIERNYEKMTVLIEKGFKLPKIYYKSNDVLDMEFISGYDMISFLQRHSPSELLDFICNTIDQFKAESIIEDYTNIYETHLESLSNDKFLPFHISELIQKLPTNIKSSLCHGDFTLENLIYRDGEFYMIDPSSGVYNSWIFDIAKLRQDLDGKWFLRKTTNKDSYNVELNFIKTSLEHKYPEAFNDNIYILMLLRVYKYVNPSDLEHKFILEEIKRLWK